jgi:hypothetical protein
MDTSERADMIIPFHAPPFPSLGVPTPRCHAPPPSRNPKGVHMKLNRAEASSLGPPIFAGQTFSPARRSF